MEHVPLLSESKHTYNDQPEDLQLYIAESLTSWYQENANDTEQIL